MKFNSYSLKTRYFLFIVLVGLTIVAAQLIIQYDINQQAEDARLINIAGRQRMLSQRISKLTAFLYYDQNVRDLAGSYRFDTLKHLLKQWETTHYYLIRQNQETRKSKVIDSLLFKNSPRVTAISEAVNSILPDSPPKVIESALDQIALVELPYLLTMETTVATYQQEAEAKLAYLKKVELLLAVLGIVLLMLEFRFLIYPFVKQLRSHNKMLQQLNLQLQEERVLLRTIIDNIPVNIYVKDLKLTKVLANKAEYEYLGATQEAAVIGKKDRDLYPSETARVSEEEDQYILKGNTIINRETRNVRHDGSESWFVISKVPLLDSSKTITGLVGISIDVTKAKKAQEELTRKENLYRLISENSHDVISLHSLDGKFEYISPSCIDLHGYTPEELVGKSGTEFMHPEDARVAMQNSESIHQKMIRGEALQPIQFRLASKHKGYIWVENVIKPVFTNNILSGFQSTVRDISARKSYEINLQVAKEKAEEATKAKSQFLSMISHEIRTPINGIMGLTNILLDEHPREDQKEKLNLLKFSSENLLTIINDILDFSKAEAGKIELEILPFNLREIAEHYILLLESKASGKGIKLTSNVDPKVPLYVEGDPVRLGQVLNNLISNAIKFTDQGVVELSLIHLHQEHDQHTIRFCVKDTGIGIAPDKVDSVFESFTQAGSDTSRKYGGTGLGLTITKDLLALMGTSVTVKSEVGVGSEFSFDLTLKEAAPVTTVVEAAPTVHRNTLSILLVEDNKVNQVVASTFLSKWGHSYDIANHGKEAVEKIQLKRYDLVLMDLQMPEMDGFEATQLIRQLPDSYYQQVPIIALTAATSTEVKEKVEAHNMNGFLSKPFQPEELWKIIQEYAPEKSIAASAFPNIEKYAEGDPVFQRELISLFIKGLEEFKSSYHQAVELNSSTHYHEAAHKAKTTIAIINSTNLNATVALAKQHFENSKITDEFSTQFSETIDEVIRDLKKLLI